MNRTTRILLIILGVLAGLALVMGIALASITRSPFPDIDGEKKMALQEACRNAAGEQNAICTALVGHGLKSPVHIFRDANGIPNIYAENTEDLYFAQGYVHAQDRMWQMEFWRHIAQGRVSEIVGEPGIENDKFIRTSGWNR
ncbi:MAG TPA: penicillin acylase family protein, partial [Promineifilum sp.]|nr:penicillin acylase family protein [Promineifilum sp.]HRQ12312.1 penicillin acylase family protein [Promineifilum sp.]